MLSDAYFQLRAQLGTALFSLIRLATEAGAQESTLTGLRAAQAELRDSFTFVALGPEQGGKSSLLNALFQRDFSEQDGEKTGQRVVIYRHGEESHDEPISAEVVERKRPFIFLRDFTIVEAGADVTTQTLGPLVSGAELVFYVVNARAAVPDAWAFLSRLGRDVLKRLIFVVWQCDRVSGEESANYVKRLRQAMLKNLGQACPIFTGSKADRIAQEKIERWIESEVILSEPRRAKLRGIDESARVALREIVNKPRQERQALERRREQVDRLRAELVEREEQAERQVAGALWTLAQSSDGLRRHGEALLREHLRPMDFLWKRAFDAEDFAREVEVQAKASFTVQLEAQLVELEGELRESVAEYFRAGRDLLPGLENEKPPQFPRAALEEMLLVLEPPLEISRVVRESFTRQVRALQLPVFAAFAAVAAAIGVAISGIVSEALVVLACGVVLFVVLLAVLLRRNAVASFGRHYAENRSSMLAALDAPLRAAIQEYYAGIVPTLEARVGELADEGQRHEPLLARLKQIEETFSRIAEDVRTGLSRPEQAL